MVAEMTVAQVLLTLAGNTAIFAFLQFLITRHDNKKGQLQKILKKMEKTERDSIRTQMLLLMSDYPEERAELFRLAEYYFKDLHGNWYMTVLFKKYLKENNLPTPAWVPDGDRAEDKI